MDVCGLVRRVQPQIAGPSHLGHVGHRPIELEDDPIEAGVVGGPHIDKRGRLRGTDSTGDRHEEQDQRQQQADTRLRVGFGRGHGVTSERCRMSTLGTRAQEGYRLMSRARCPERRRSVPKASALGARSRVLGAARRSPGQRGTRRSPEIRAAPSQFVNSRSSVQIRVSAPLPPVRWPVSGCPWPESAGSGPPDVTPENTRQCDQHRCTIAARLPGPD